MAPGPVVERCAFGLAVALGIGGCGAILGFDDFTPPGPSTASSGGGAAGGAGHGGASSAGGAGGAVGGGGSGGGDPKYHCFTQGEPSTLISETDVPGAQWTGEAFFVVPWKDPPGGVHVVAFDDAGKKLYMRSVDDPDKPQEKALASWDATANGSSSRYVQAEATGDTLTLYAGNTPGVGKLTTSIQAGAVVPGTSAFTPFSPMPSECGPAPAHASYLSVVDDSWAFTCSDGAATNEALSLFLDGQLVDSGTDKGRLAVVAHHLVGGKHVLFTGPELAQGYWRLGATPLELMTPHAVSIATRADHASSIGQLVPGTDAADMFLFGGDIGARFSSIAFSSGRVGADAISLGATPPTGMSEGYALSDVSQFCLNTQPSFNGSTVVLAGATADQKSVLLSLVAKDGKGLIWNFQVAKTSGSFAVAGAAQAGGNTIFVAWVEGGTVKMQSVICTPLT